MRIINQQKKFGAHFRFALHFFLRGAQWTSPPGVKNKPFRKSNVQYLGTIYALYIRVISIFVLQPLRGKKNKNRPVLP